MNEIMIHAYVSGKVQGVFFRDHTRRRAIDLNLKGWVRNLADGRVEVMALGEPFAIKSFLDWLKTGPPKAKVSDLYWEEKKPNAFTDFSVV